jgi:hypothetical protein
MVTLKSMPWKPLSLSLMMVVLIACGGNYQDPDNGNGGNNKPPAPDPCAGNDFSVTYSPTSSAFLINKGQSVTLRATVSISCPNTAKVRFSFSSDWPGVTFSPSSMDVTGNGEGSITVRLDTSAPAGRPFFTVSAQGLNKNNDKRGQELYPTTFQWTPQ